MLSSFNQITNQGFRFNISDNPMNDLTSNFGYQDNYNSKTELFNQYFNTNQYVGNAGQDLKMYSISEVDSLMHSNTLNSQIENNQDFDIGLLSSRLQSMGIKPNSSMSRSNSAHNSPFDSRIAPRIFSQSTSNTPVPMTNRMTRDVDVMRGNPPIMQLFPGGNAVASSTSQINGYNISRQSPVELIEYQSIASKMGFLVGQDLEEVLSRSATMKNSNSSRISNFFKHKHGSSGGHCAVKQYLVLGVRVPSKEHVSEIVGKEGKKIKMIRQTTGALIATPNEKEDHVFLIEAVPETALKVGQIIQQLADQISRNKLGTQNGSVGERPRSPPVLGNRTPLATATIGVPQRLVGKVIGTQGSIITTVQKETGTEIKSPPKDELRAPEDNADFEISVYENGTVNSEETAWLQIHRAKQLIAHLVMRVWDSQPRNSTPSSDEGHGTCSQGLFAPEWIWPEVARMDDGDAKEIVDRILRSSKAKITPSTSSAEGVSSMDSAAALTGLSPPFPMSMLESKNAGYHSVHTTPYKVYSSGRPSTADDDSNWCHLEAPHRRMEHYQQYSADSGNQRSSFYSDSAFYDQYSYDNGYMADNGFHDNGYHEAFVPNNNHSNNGYHNGGGSYHDNVTGNNVYHDGVTGNNVYHDGVTASGTYYDSHNGYLDSSTNSGYSNGVTDWSKPVLQYNYEDSRFGNVKHIWRNDVHDTDVCATTGTRNSQRPAYGTIGDGRKRYSAASISDDREDL